MHIPKRYGESRNNVCPFCKRPATVASVDGFPVCVEHKNSSMPEMKCACGSIMDLKNGKFGPFFNCFHCGNVNASKAFEINDLTKSQVIVGKPNGQVLPKKMDSFAEIPDKRQPKEVVVRADDPFYFS
jgi:hypothetical protein